MPDEVKPTDNTQLVEKTETVETVPMAGIEQGGTVNKLADIFSRVEKGEDVDDAIKQVNAPSKETKNEDKGTSETNEEVTKKQEPSDLDSKLTERKAEKQEEVTRESLRKQAEKGVETKTETKPEDEVDPSELAVLPHDKPKTAKRIQALLKRIDVVTQAETTTKKELEARDTKLKELQSELEKVKSVDPKTNEDIKKQLDELAMFRRRYDLDNDPEVKTKFDARAESSEKSIKEVLTKNGAGEGLLKLIDDEGGWMKFTESSRVIKMQDGNVTAAELAESILQSLPLSARKGVEAAMMDVVNTKRDKQRFFEEEQKKATEYFSKKEQEKNQQTESQKKAIEENVKAIEAWQKTILEKEAFLKEKEIPANATKDQKAAIEEHNKYTKQMNTLLKKTLSVSTRDEMLEVALDSVRYWDEKRKVGQLQAELDKIKAELKAKSEEVDKVRNASRSTPRNVSIATGTPPSSTPNKVVGIEAAFGALEQGHKLDRHGNILTANNDE